MSLLRSASRQRRYGPKTNDYFSLFKPNHVFFLAKEGEKILVDDRKIKYNGEILPCGIQDRSSAFKMESVRPNYGPPVESSLGKSASSVTFGGGGALFLSHMSAQIL